MVGDLTTEIPTNTCCATTNLSHKRRGDSRGVRLPSGDKSCANVSTRSDGDGCQHIGFDCRTGDNGKGANEANLSDENTKPSDDEVGYNWDANIEVRLRCRHNY